MNDPSYYLHQLKQHWTSGFYTGISVGIAFTSAVFFSIYLILTLL